jgi:hypothetical protein
MKRLLLVVVAILLLAGVAQGVTKVYPEDVIGTETFSGTSSGISMSVINGVAGTGDTTVVSVAAGSVLRLMRYDFKPDQDITGTVNLQVGATNTYSINNSLADNVYGENLIPNFYEGADGEDLIINTPDDVRYNIMYRVD